MLGLRETDLLAVADPPGPAWRELLAEVREAGAALLPVDHRLPVPERQALLVRARPTAVLEGGDVVRLEGGLPVAEGVALVIATSGSRGAPKLAELSWPAVEAQVTASSAALGCGPADPWLCCLPLAHVAGLLVVARSSLVGAPVAIHPGFDPAAVDADRAARFISLVPTMLRRLLETGVDLARFERILVGGDRLPEDLVERAAAGGARVVTAYGLTESCGGVVYDGWPLAGTRVRVGAGDEILLRGPTLMSGYRLAPEATGTAIREGWLRTCDAGALDAEGRLRVLGRLDDVVVSGGEKVWPTEVEAVLLRHPAVADALVEGREDQEWGQVVVARIVPRDPTEPPELEALRDFVAEHLARYKAPRVLEIVKELPRAGLGKLRRASLPD